MHKTATERRSRSILSRTRTALLPGKPFIGERADPINPSVNRAEMAGFCLSSAPSVFLDTARSAARSLVHCAICASAVTPVPAAVPRCDQFDSGCWDPSHLRKCTTSLFLQFVGCRPSVTVLGIVHCVKLCTRFFFSSGFGRYTAVRKFGVLRRFSENYRCASLP